MLAEFCTECLKNASVYHNEEKPKRGTNLVKRTLRRLVKNTLEDFPSWDPNTLAFSNTPSDMEKLMIAMLVIFGPVQLVTDEEEEEETPKPEEKTNSEHAKATKTPSPTPKPSTKKPNPYSKTPTSNVKPPNKAKKGTQAKEKKITLTPLFLKVKHSALR